MISSGAGRQYRVLSLIGRKNSDSNRESPVFGPEKGEKARQALEDRSGFQPGACGFLVSPGTGSFFAGTGYSKSLFRGQQGELLFVFAFPDRLRQDAREHYPWLKSDLTVDTQARLPAGGRVRPDARVPIQCRHGRKAPGADVRFKACIIAVSVKGFFGGEDFRRCFADGCVRRHAVAEFRHEDGRRDPL